MNQTVRKAVFPVAGLGTRFLPATKAMPKEMLPIVDRPLIQYAVEEAKSAGIEEFIFVTGRGKASIENHFDHSIELENFLNKLAYIDKDFWIKSELHTKIFFSLFDSNVKFVNDFINSLNYSKKEKKLINELFDLKNSIINKSFIDDFVDRELVSNIYHCL